MICKRARIYSRGLAFHPDRLMLSASERTSLRGSVHDSRLTLMLYFDVDTFDVLWFCPNCDNNGRISGWQGTFWDNPDLPDTMTEQVS